MDDETEDRYWNNTNIKSFSFDEEDKVNVLHFNILFCHHNEQNRVFDPKLMNAFLCREDLSR